MVTDIKFYKVGGFVRDFLMGRQSKDIDYAVEAPSYEAMRDHIAQHGKIWQERPQFFTVRAKLNGEDCDYVLCRKEGFYSDGRRPDSVEMGTIFDDLARRDFTVNAIAMNEVGALIDPHNGRKDIEAGILRCVGVAYDRFSEDSLRLIRAIRFAVTKNLHIDFDIQHCLSNDTLLDKLENCSIERMYEELVKSFTFNTMRTLDLLNVHYKLRDRLFAGGDLYLTPTLIGKK